MLYVLVGPIASGKSTFCKQAVSKKGAVIVSDDGLTQAMSAGLYTYNQKLLGLYKDIEHTITTHAIDKGLPVIIDRPCHKAATRQRFVQIAKSLDASTVAIEFKREKPWVHADRRFNDDPRGHNFEYWLRVAKLHDESWEPITEHEGFDNIIPANVALEMLDSNFF